MVDESKSYDQKEVIKIAFNYGILISASHRLDLSEGDVKVARQILYEIIPDFKKTIPSKIAKELFPSFLEGLEERCQDLLKK